MSGGCFYPASSSSGDAVSGSLKRSSSGRDCCSAAARRRCSSAASCTTVRDHTTLAQWNDSSISVIHARIKPTPGPGWPAATVCRDQTADTEDQREPDEHPGRQGHCSRARMVAAEQHIPTPHVAGVRQNERRQQHEHQDGNHQGSCARLNFAGNTPFGVLEVGTEGVELAEVLVVARHRVHPRGSSDSAGRPTVGMPRPMCGAGVLAA
jgi:hypothetical protein